MICQNIFSKDAFRLRFQNLFLLSLFYIASNNNTILANINIICKVAAFGNELV